MIFSSSLDIFRQFRSAMLRSSEDGATFAQPLGILKFHTGSTADKLEQCVVSSALLAVIQLGPVQDFPNTRD